MVVRYDGGPFSHVGIVVDAGVMASSRTNHLSLEALDDRDTGGVRLNAIADLMGRQPHVGRPRSAEAERIVAATRTLDLLEYGAAHRSAFSFVKLFIVAAGLDAVRPDQDPGACRAILAAVAQAAELWEMSEQARLGQEPSFFCSEAICAAYPSLRFTYGDFAAVRPPNPGPCRDDPAVATLEEPGWFVPRVRRLIDGAKPTAEQRRAVMRVGLSLAIHDLRFLGELAAALFDFLDPQALEAVPTPPPPEARLPTALVTPRMLARSPWLEPVRPVRLC